jgi:hypothetical protein
MRKFSTILFAFALGACTSFDREPHVLSESAIRPFADFVAQRTGYFLEPLPKVVVSQDAVQNALTANGYSADGFAHAYYARAERTIYFDHTTFEFADPQWQALLVHELTHHGQELSTRTFRCRGQAEGEAYEIQSAYLVERGERSISATFIDRISRC